ncbi:MAG: GNAT family N-acetyltransferase, partial [Lachnospiraceae bacterium]|nr:GNAT family N-acetyltransferase [Lachnospiraceae bacterium]
VSVSRLCRRRGIGKALLTTALSLARTEHGAENFTLEMRVSNAPARALYERLGFTYEGTRPGYYTHPREDACIYWMR